MKFAVRSTWPSICDEDHPLRYISLETWNALIDKSVRLRLVQPGESYYSHAKQAEMISNDHVAIFNSAIEKAWVEFGSSHGSIEPYWGGSLRREVVQELADHLNEIK